jgi:hypothetical protein
VALTKKRFSDEKLILERKVMEAERRASEAERKVVVMISHQNVLEEKNTRLLASAQHWKNQYNDLVS